MKFKNNLLLVLISVGVFLQIFTAIYLWTSNYFNIICYCIFSISVVLVVVINYHYDGFFSLTFAVPAYYYIMFSILPIMEELLRINSYVDLSFSKSWLYATIGMLIFLFSSRLTRPYLKLNNIDYNVKIKRISIILNNYKIISIFYFIGLIASVYSIQSGYFGLLETVSSSISILSGLIFILTKLVHLSNIISWINYFLNKNRKWLFLGLVSTSTIILMGILSNSKSAIITPLVLLFIIKTIVQKRVDYKLITFATLIFSLFVLPFIYYLRINLYNVILLNRIDYFQFVLNYLMNGDWIINIGKIDFTIKALGRDLFNVFNLIINETGINTNYTFGETYLNGFLTIIPRFIYPDKPAVNFGNLVGYKYHLIYNNDFITNSSPSIMGEMYMNFGIIGIILGMLVLGWISKKLLIKSELNTLIWIKVIIFSTVIWQESMFGHTVIPFLITMLLFSILIKTISLTMIQMSFRK